MNREARRQMKAEAERLATQLSLTCIDYDQTGRRVRVTNDLAIAALRTAFAAMLRGGCVPLILEIEEGAASAFPSGGQDVPRVGPAMRPWLAVGIDVGGQATYSLRWLAAVGLDSEAERDWAEVTMLAQLADQMNVSGYPASMTTEDRADESSI